MPPSMAGSGLSGSASMMPGLSSSSSSSNISTTSHSVGSTDTCRKKITAAALTAHSCCAATEAEHHPQLGVMPVKRCHACYIGLHASWVSRIRFDHQLAAAYADTMPGAVCSPGSVAAGHEVIASSTSRTAAHKLRDVLSFTRPANKNGS
jgi:hypothetical protein